MMIDKETPKETTEIDNELDTSDTTEEQDVAEAQEELSEVDQLRLDLETANEAKLRALADFKNYQRRSLENETRAVSGGMARIVRAIIPAIEQINLAIEHSEDDAAVQGFQMARDELLRGLEDCGVTRIEPEVGDPFNPQLHEAMLRQDSEDLEADHIVMLMQVGFELGDIVICPAKVGVSS
jgi:molecular chaperone GrpE